MGTLLSIYLFIYSISLRVIILVFSSQSQAHDGQVINEYEGYALSHKGRAKDPDNVYSSADGPEAYTNPNAYEKMVQYTEAARMRHGPTYDPARQPLDTDILMRTGGGKQHGRYFIAHSAIDPATVPTLRQVRRSDSTTSSDVPIRPRQPSHTQALEAVQVTLVSFVVHWFYICTFPFALFKHRGCNIAVPAGRVAGRAGGLEGGLSAGDGGPR